VRVVPVSHRPSTAARRTHQARRRRVPKRTQINFLNFLSSLLVVLSTFQNPRVDVRVRVHLIHPPPTVGPAFRSLAETACQRSGVEYPTWSIILIITHQSSPNVSPTKDRSPLPVNHEKSIRTKRRQHPPDQINLHALCSRIIPFSRLAPSQHKPNLQCFEQKGLSSPIYF
jgi:hypothetical protein